MGGGGTLSPPFSVTILFVMEYSKILFVYINTADLKTNPFSYVNTVAMATD